MKTRKRMIVRFVLIATAVICGSVIPYGLFGYQEQKLLWNKEVIPYDTASVEQSGTSIVIQESEYIEILKSLYGNDEVYYHEPLEGQLNMTNAVTRCFDAINYILKPLQGAKNSNNSFNNIKAVLQTKDADYIENPQYSYWNMILSNEEMKVTLQMNSISGKILNMDMDLYGQGELEEEQLKKVLANYVAFIGLEAAENEIVMNEYGAVYKSDYYECSATQYNYETSNFTDEYVMIQLQCNIN